MNRHLWATMVAGSLALTGCWYDSYPTPKPVRTPGIDPQYYVQHATYETDRPVVVTDAGPPVVRVERPVVSEIRPFAQWTEQEAAADALGRIGAGAIPYLQQALRSPDRQVKLQAVQVLARMGSDAQPAVNDLIPLLDDPDPEVRKETVRTLGRIGPEAAAAIPALMRSLVQPEPLPPEAGPSAGSPAEPNLLPHAPPPRS